MKVLYAILAIGMLLAVLVIVMMLVVSSAPPVTPVTPSAYEQQPVDGASARRLTAR